MQPSSKNSTSSSSSSSNSNQGSNSLYNKQNQIQNKTETSNIPSTTIVSPLKIRIHQNNPDQTSIEDQFDFTPQPTTFRNKARRQLNNTILTSDIMETEDSFMPNSTNQLKINTRRNKRKQINLSNNQLGRSYFQDKSDLKISTDRINTDQFLINTTDNNIDLFSSQKKNDNFSMNQIPQFISGDSEKQQQQQQQLQRYTSQIDLGQEIQTETQEQTEDEIFQQQRLFKNEETNVRNSTKYFLKFGIFCQILMFDVIKYLIQIKRKKKRNSMNMNDVPLLGKCDHSYQDSLQYDERVSKLPDNKKNASNYFNILQSIFRVDTSIIYVFVIIFILLNILNSYALQIVIFQINNMAESSEVNADLNNDSFQKLMISCTVLVLCKFLGNYSLHVANRFSYQYSIKMRNMFLNLIYNNILKQSLQEIQKTDIGKLMNIASNDFNLIEQKTVAIFVFRCFPIFLILCSILLYNRFGFIGLSSLGLQVIFFVILNLMSKQYKKQAKKRSKQNDNRIKIQKEVVQGIKLLKMYVWEQPFIKIIEKIRKKELFNTFWMFFWFNAGEAVNQTSVFICMVVQIIILIILDQHETITTANILSTLDLLTFIQLLLGIGYKGMMGYNEMLNVLGKCYNIHNVKIHQDLPCDGNKDEYTIKLENYNGYWQTKEQEGKPILQNINFIAKHKQMTAVLGSVGSGKTSFLSILMNKMPYYEGKAIINGSIAFAEQQPHIFQGTVRDNIVLDQYYNNDWYETVLEACCVIDDIENMKLGDQTVIGDNSGGIQLSDGQKARISLARAVYQKKDIYLLDDPLSAVDVSVAKQILKNVIKGILKDKTVILATHQIDMIEQYTDYVLYLQNQTICQQGSYNQLRNNVRFMFKKRNSIQLDNDKEVLAQLQEINLNIIQQQLSQNEIESPEIINRGRKKSTISNFGRSSPRKRSLSLTPKNNKQDSQQLSTQNKKIIFKTTIDFSVYLAYFRLLGPYILTFIFVCHFFFDYYIFIVIFELFGEYQKSNLDEKKVLNNTIMIYTGIFLISQIVRYSNWAQMHLRAMRKLHSNLLNNCFSATSQYFDNTQLGQILNLYSNDLGVCDVQLFQYFVDYLDKWLIALILLGYICFINYYLIVIVLLQLFMLILFYVKTKSVLSQSRSLDLKMKSHIFQHLTNTISSSTNLKIYNLIPIYQQKFQNIVDNSQRCSYAFWDLQRAFALIGQQINSFFGMIIIFFIILFTVFQLQNEDDLEKKDRYISNLGIMIVYILRLQDNIPRAIRVTSKIDIGLTSFNRINYSIQSIPIEKQTSISQLNFKVLSGTINFKKASISYNSNTMLKQLDLDIEAGEKVAIIGKSGAGKSTVLQALFRMKDIDDFDNHIKGIFIDQQRIQNFDIKSIRSNISIIPQTPFIFTGSIKFNLDPFQKFTDERIEALLEELQLFEYIKSQKMTINSEVSPNSNLFTIGQKQLICLGRAILQNNKILVIDEATSNVDQETDNLIQKLIKQEFQYKTVIAIAHRLETIAEYDKVLVLDKGEQIQFGQPYTLMKQNDNSDNPFMQMVSQTDINQQKNILKLAKRSYKVESEEK